ncbi:alpha-L-arabinofuranosidase C-terminal domain-containing protein [Clostridium cibarium]|uniref:Alpha-L-arabinofuranosidase C-terminal domain-containing protein n=1 Tax=Clostridium cibarium TaxID=2762247 RepID=A0ABR8PYR3_9CLOT|nr:hypothetical protein [Clostridium cibarium]
MRDAIVASINLNLFNEHSDRVIMANIAQVVNVLQSVILTEGDKMIKTPTYHVFNMYKHHQDSILVSSFIKNDATKEEYSLPSISKSVSLDKDNKLHLTMSNCSLLNDYALDINILDYPFGKVSGKLLTEKMTAHNTFENPNKVYPIDFKDYTITDEGIKFIIPKCSVLSLTLE